ncbi:MAG TPA: glycosyltransferase [Chitinophagaceae bacterium]|nr:glycosyltransferase [Chitinophagaceae bacterium]
MDSPLVSICIPTYERIGFFKKLLSNIAEQSFKDYEIIITDNSISNDIEEYIAVLGNPTINYIRNNPAISMGENWNKCFSLAKGQWLKMMHDDDYFSSPYSLQKFVDAAEGKKAGIIFGKLCFNNENGDRREFFLSQNTVQRIATNPVDLIGTGNKMGNPCNTLIHRDVIQPFNPELRWIIDFECYIRMLSSGASLYYIDEVLVEIFYHAGQVTTEVFLNKAVEIPENDYLLHTYYPQNMSWFFSFDYFWRKIRNLGIRSIDAYRSFLPADSTPKPAIMRIISFQGYCPPRLLRVGIASKVLSWLCWLSLKVFPA